MDKFKLPEEIKDVVRATKQAHVKNILLTMGEDEALRLYPEEGEFIDQLANHPVYSVDAAQDMALAFMQHWQNLDASERLSATIDLKQHMRDWWNEEYRSL